MEVMLFLRHAVLEVAAPPKGLFSRHWLHKLAPYYVLSIILKLEQMCLKKEVFFRF